MVRKIIKIVGRIIIVKIITKPTSTELEKEYEWLLTSSEEIDLEGVSHRGGVVVSVTLLEVDDGSVAGLYFNIETVQ